MIYLAQRLIINENQWIRPSVGRLGRKGEGGYVHRNGFGHEDWNFNHNHAIKGKIYGYCYYQPAIKKQEKLFNIAFTIYKDGHWQLVGFYLNASFVETPPIDSEIIKGKLNDLKELSSFQSLGVDWKHLTDTQMIDALKDDSVCLNWQCAVENVIPTKHPITIPDKIFNIKNYRITNPTEIDERTFYELFTLNLKDIPKQRNSNIEDSFPEGLEVERKHKLREKNSKVVKLAKEKFKKNNGKLFCQICKFDFEEKYSEIGEGFIEAHHTIPISEMEDNHKTNISDIAIVCSNCHRMLHRRRPWLKMNELRTITQ